MRNEPTFGVLKRKTLASVTGAEVDSDRIEFMTTRGRKFVLYHSQGCCEHVRLAEVIGDVNDLIGTPILYAAEVSSEGHPAPEHPDSYTWTFYRLTTIKGSVTLRWLGESNGYYSESVSFVEIS